MASNHRKSKLLLKRLKPQIIKWLKESVSKKRYKHIISVSKTARQYAKNLKLDLYKAELSGLLHDIAKEIPSQRLLRIAKQKKIKLYQLDKENPHMLHARIGAVIAKEKFKIKDKDILGGIRCHTLAEPHMPPLAMVVYVADATEPGRKKKTIVPIRKTLKEKGLEAAALHAMDSKLIDILNRKKKIHPLTIEARNWLINKLKIYLRKS